VKAEGTVSSAIPVVSTSSWDIRWSRTDVGTRSEEKLKENPYDVDDWGVLINEAKVLLTPRVLLSVCLCTGLSLSLISCLSL
jgi:hypothetical protein